jgi:hypothetical protein
LNQAKPVAASCWTRISEWKLNIMKEDLNVMGSGLTLVQRVAICFAAGVIGGLAVVFFSHLLFALGVSAILGVNEPVSLKSPEIYRPLFWAGLWGIPFGLLIKAVWRRLYLFGLLYFLAGAGVVHDLPADERRGVFRASAGAEVHALPAAGKSAVRDNHRSGRKGDYWEEAVSTVMLFNDSGSNPEL